MKSIFCPLCVVMNSDREIRAREGQMELLKSRIYRSRYKDGQPPVVTAQPTAHRPMRYISPRATNLIEGNGDSEYPLRDALVPILPILDFHQRTRAEHLMVSESDAVMNAK